MTNIKTIYVLKYCGMETQCWITTAKQTARQWPVNSNRGMVLYVWSALMAVDATKAQKEKNAVFCVVCAEML
jgi:hypothetical protein